MGNQRNFSLEFKRQVVEELISVRGGAAQFCRKCHIYSGLLYHRKDMYNAAGQDT